MNKIIFISLILVQFLFTQQLGDIIYKYNGEVIKGNIISGGNSGDYYVQIKSEDGYINIYMYEVKEIKRQVPIQQQESSVLPQEKNLTPNVNLPVTKKYIQQKIINKQPKEATQNKGNKQKNSQTSSLSNKQRMMRYKTKKKIKGTAMLLSFIIPSAGHAYAGNWGSGINFFAAEVGFIYSMSVLGNTEHCTPSNSSVYSIESCEDMPNIFFWIGYFGFLSTKIYEIFDAGKEVKKYNQRLLMSNGFSLNIVPQKQGATLKLAYSF